MVLRQPLCAAGATLAAQAQAAQRQVHVVRRYHNWVGFRSNQSSMARIDNAFRSWNVVAIGKRRPGRLTQVATSPQLV